MSWYVKAIVALIAAIVLLSLIPWYWWVTGAIVVLVFQFIKSEKSGGGHTNHYHRHYWR